MLIKFWGVRGSVPSPGGETARYGGNTACLSVEIDGKILVLDAGSGIRDLGLTLLDGQHEIFILLTHLHTDHILGFPFFAPLHQPGRNIHLLDYDRNGARWSLLNLIDGIHFPLCVSDLVSSPINIEGDVLGYLGALGFNIRRMDVNHPGGAYGYRIEQAGRVLVHIPDNEIDPPGVKTTPYDVLVAFCSGADVLVHDAQYLRTEMPAKWGWGHSVVNRVCDLAVSAGVKELILFHHDPARKDKEVDQIQSYARSLLKPKGIACRAAYEGLRIDLNGDGSG